MGTPPELLPKEEDMCPYPWTNVGTASGPGHLDRVAATLLSGAPAAVAHEACDIGQWEGQDVPSVRPCSCILKGGISSSGRHLPTYPPQICIVACVAQSVILFSRAPYNLA